MIVTAEVGEGHAAAARALAADLAHSGKPVDVVFCDALAGLGPPLRYLLLDAYRWQLRVAPWIFGGFYRLFTRVAAARALGRAGLVVLGAGSLLRLVESHDPDLVVSTYPAATNVLGHLRQSGRLTKPVYATITDLAGLTFWSHPGIDLHFVMHESCVSEVEALPVREAPARCDRWSPRSSFCLAREQMHSVRWIFRGPVRSSSFPVAAGVSGISSVRFAPGWRSSTQPLSAWPAAASARMSACACCSRRSGASSCGDSAIR